MDRPNVNVSDSFIALCEGFRVGPSQVHLMRAAREIVRQDGEYLAIAPELRPHRGEVEERKVRAARELLRPDLVGGEALRSAAKILRGDS